jgi:hypothetical protein
MSKSCENSGGDRAEINKNKLMIGNTTSEERFKELRLFNSEEEKAIEVIY